MAKIIKVGSQNPTFTSQSKKAGSIQTVRNSNEVTNPFKFTNFEGNTLQFADVFEGFKPSLKSSPANKLRLVASSVTGSMNKMKTGIAESIANFANRVRAGVVNAWDYAKNTNISDVPGIKQVNAGIKQVNDILNTPINIPAIDGLASKMTLLKEGLSSKVSAMGSSAANWTSNMSSRINGIKLNIAFHGRQKYANMSVAELETELRTALAEGGINE